MFRNEKLLEPRIGLGTWHMGSDPSERANEVAALRAGIEMGVTVIDTAEMYANGGAEEVTAEAIAGHQRDQLYLVSKVLPHNASQTGAIAACEDSLRRLKTDYLDLYLLHWRGPHPLEETIEAFETLVERGLIRQWGVSNFDMSDMYHIINKWNGKNCAVNQTYYSLGHRGIEYDLVSWQFQQEIATMAYCPLDEGRLAHDERLQWFAERHNATCAQIALAWIMRFRQMIPIPKSSSVERTRENALAREVELAHEDMVILDDLFPPPMRKVPLKVT